MKSNTRYKQNKRGRLCHNCQANLSGVENFCPNCGQVNDDRPLNLKEFIQEFFSGFFSFDTRLFKTLGPLLFKPGMVSKEYIAGQRKKYSNPFQLYLHTSILLFLVIGLISAIQSYFSLDKAIEAESIVVERGESEIFDSVQAKLVFEVQKMILIEGKIDSILEGSDYYTQFHSNLTPKSVKDSLYDEIVKIGIKAGLPDFVNQNVQMNVSAIPELLAATREYENSTRSYINKVLEIGDEEYGSYAISVDFLNGFSLSKIFKFDKWRKFVKYDLRHEDRFASRALDSLEISKTRSNMYWYQRAQDYNKIQSDKAFRNNYIQSIVSRISLVLFFLLPLFALFFRLLYIRGNHSYTEHLIVVFYLQTVFFILLLLGIVLDAIFKTDMMSALFVLLFGVYFFLTLKRFYGQGKVKTFFKFLLLNMGYIIMASMGVLVLMALSFFV